MMAKARFLNGSGTIDADKMNAEYCREHWTVYMYMHGKRYTYLRLTVLGLGGPAPRRWDDAADRKVPQT